MRTYESQFKLRGFLNYQTHMRRLMLVRALEIWPGLSSQQLCSGLGLTPSGRMMCSGLLRELHEVIGRRDAELLRALQPYAHGDKVSEFWTITDLKAFPWPLHALQRSGQQAARARCVVNQHLSSYWP